MSPEFPAPPPTRRSASTAQALKDQLPFSFRNIKMIDDGEAILKGTVGSIEREEAERAAWSAPGIRKVENKLLVKPS
jgi:osmotically-inducible protein OsmY